MVGSTAQPRIYTRAALAERSRDRSYVIAVRLLLPIAAVGWALLFAEQGWGLFKMRALPVWLAVVLPGVEQNQVPA
jgi:hypothetical protein